MKKGSNEPPNFEKPPPPPAPPRSGGHGVANCSTVYTWPPRDVVTKLVEATTILLDRYDYDGHGYEVIHAAREQAIKFLRR